MLMPDVTEILNDPEVGGGQSFQVVRYSAVRNRGGYNKTATVYDASGNVQPQDLSNQPSTAEDLLTETIVIYSTFGFQAGSNTGSSIIEADIILYDNLQWRVTRVDDWSKWGYSRAYATRVKEKVVVPPVNNSEEPAATEG